MSGARPSLASPALLALACLLSIGLAARGLALLTLGDVPELHGDEVYYVSGARDLAEGRPPADTFRPPGFSAFLALVVRAGDGSLASLRLAQAAASLLLVAAVYDLVRRRFGMRAAFLSGLVCALHPTLVQYAHFLWSESFFSTVLVGAIWCLDRWDASRRAAWLVAAGASLAIAAATREIALGVAPIAALWVWLADAGPVRTRALSLVALAAPLALVLALWLGRSHAVHGGLGPLSTNGWYAMALGNLLPSGRILGRSPEHARFQAAFQAVPTELGRMELARETALRAIAAEQPAWLVRKLARNGILLFTPRSQLARFVDGGWVRPEHETLARRLVCLEAAFYVAATALGIAALWLVPGGRTKALVVAIVVLHLVVHVVANATHRFRVPLLPLLALYTGPLLCGHARLDRGARWRVVGAAASLAGFAAIVAGALREP